MEKTLEISPTVLPTLSPYLAQDNHINTSSLVFTGRMLFLITNQQSTEGKMLRLDHGDILTKS